MKNYEQCPKRHYHVDLIRDFKEEEGEHLQWGNAVHKALAERVSKGTALPKSMAEYEKWVTPIVTSASNGLSVVMVEQQLAIDENFAATKWFSSDAQRSGMSEPWYRSIIDVLKIVGPVALMIDWKTGKVVEDSQQLALAAACVFAHYPHIMKIRSEFIWLKEDARSRGDFHRNEMAPMWKALWPRIEALKVAHETTNYPAKPGYLCRRYCPVTDCVHHGEGA
jgi:hypothetical protein